MFELWIISLRHALPTLYLSADEQTRAAQFHFEADRARFQRSHSALRQILGATLSVDPLHLSFGVTDRGKPYVSDGRLHFNLSHADDLAVCAVADHAVGVDVEHVRPIPDWRDLARMVFSAEEQQALTNTSEAQRASVFFSLWTRKEALVKATGTGITDQLTAFSVPADPVTTLSYLATITPPSALRTYALYAFAPASDYLGAVAIDADHLSLPTIHTLDY